MTLKQHTEYKESGLPLTPMVPSHWQRTALKHLGGYQNGYPFKPEDRGEEGLPIIRISQLTSDDEPAYFDGELDGRVKIRTGDLLFSWSATIDSYIWNQGDAWLNQHIFKVTESQEAVKGFLYYVIKHVAPKLADFDAHGSTMRHIKKESLGEKLYIPPRQEQLAIAGFLDRETAKIDSLITEQQRLIELLQEKRQAVISHAVTKGLNPNAQMKDSGVEWLGEVPEHWQETRLKRLFKPIKAQGYPQLEVLSVYRDYGVIAKSTRNDNFNQTPEDLSKYQLVEPGCLVINKMKCWQGSLGVSELKGITSPDYAVFTPIHQENSEFLHNLVRSKAYSSIYMAISNGIRPNQWRVEPERFLALPAFLPSPEEQIRIAEYIKSKSEGFNCLADLAILQVSLLQEHRSALISAAVTGQIDVRGLVPEAVEQ
jgi:type I restriction enzyme S subunit